MTNYSAVENIYYECNNIFYMKVYRLTGKSMHCHILEFHEKYYKRTYITRFARIGILTLTDGKGHFYHVRR